MIELLVVISILALLLLILFPVLSAIRASQRNKRVAATATALETAAAAYASDFGLYPQAEPPTDFVADGPNKGNRALVHWLQLGEDAGGRSSPYLPTPFYDDGRRIEGDVLLDEWERPFIYFDTSAMTDDTVHPYDIEGDPSVRPAKGTRGYFNLGRCQVWSVGANGRNDGGPNRDDEHNDDKGNFDHSD